MGIGFTFTAEGGPVIDRPIRSGRDVKGVRAIDPRDELGYVMETLRLVRRELDDEDAADRLRRSARSRWRATS